MFVVLPTREELAGQLKFPFPSNGRARLNMLQTSGCKELIAMFPFPSNGRARLNKLVRHSTSKGSCRFHSLQTGERVSTHRTRTGRTSGYLVSIPFKRDSASQRISPKDITNSGQPGFPFPSNGIARLNIVKRSTDGPSICRFPFPSNGIARLNRISHSSIK